MITNNNLQETNTVLMVRPAMFSYNQDTAGDNHFQSDQWDDIAHTPQEYALKEFDDFVDLLMSFGVDVIVAEDTVHPATPDSIFPNNWFTTHQNGKLILYPLYGRNRRLESKKPEIYNTLIEAYEPTEVIDLRPNIEQGLYLESTGSMVLDRINRRVYACLSERTSEQLLRQVCDLLNYQAVPFRAVDRDGEPIYHTNVMMMVSEDLAVICSEAIPDDEARALVLASLREGGHQIVDISLDQLYHYAGNMLALRNKDNERLIVMSRQAYLSLRPEQIEMIESKAKIVSPEIPTIERLGGGSARCMMAEIFPH